MNLLPRNINSSQRDKKMDQAGLIKNTMLLEKGKFIEKEVYKFYLLDTIIKAIRLMYLELYNCNYSQLPVLN